MEIFEIDGKSTFTTHVLYAVLKCIKLGNTLQFPIPNRSFSRGYFKM